ncbi:hypothetical protein [Streptomyces albogriseolus]|uniref:hypothetical protein n=1 Tax=Streptomyces albogriseolus TaxID=1887 RepID=UPI0034617861
MTQTTTAAAADDDVMPDYEELAAQAAHMYGLVHNAFAAMLPVLQELGAQCARTARHFQEAGLLDEDFKPRRHGVTAQTSPYGPPPKRSRRH